MSRDDDALGGPYYAPGAIKKIRDHRRWIDEQVADGEMTLEEGNKAKREFASMQIAHHREHGSAEKPS